MASSQLYKCSRCGHIIAASAPKCVGCGTPGPIARHPNSWQTTEPAEAIAEMLSAKGAERRDLSAPAPAGPGGVLERDAETRLKRAHNKLVGILGAGGAVLVLVVFVILLVIADSMGRTAGGVFVFMMGLLAASGLIALLIPRHAEAFVQRMPAPKDPLTGGPMRMLWWWRWFAGALAFFMVSALGSYTGSTAPHSSNSGNLAATVMNCFCNTLSTERKAEAAKNDGVPYSDSPDREDVIGCVQHQSGVDKNKAEKALLKEYHAQARAGVYGLQACRRADISVYAGEPAPASPEIMRAARESYCESLTVPLPVPMPTYDPTHPDESNKALKEWGDAVEALDYTKFARRLHISKKEAHAALDRAASESLIGSQFVCEGGKAIAKPFSEIEARARQAARRAICDTVHVPPWPSDTPPDTVMSQVTKSATISAFKNDPAGKEFIATGGDPKLLLREAIGSMHYPDGCAKALLSAATPNFRADEAAVEAPATAAETAAARKAFCEAFQENPGNGIPVSQANKIYQSLTGEGFDRTESVMGREFAKLVLRYGGSTAAYCGASGS